jgi:hypothetical protein
MDFSDLYCLVPSTSLFGIPQRFFSDQGPHFRNQVMRELVKRLNIIHDFSTRIPCADPFSTTFASPM